MEVQHYSIFYYIDTKLKIILAAQLEANLAAYARFEHSLKLGAFLNIRA